MLVNFVCKHLRIEVDISFAVSSTLELSNTELVYISLVIPMTIFLACCINKYLINTMIAVYMGFGILLQYKDCAASIALSDAYNEEQHANVQPRRPEV